MCISFHEVLKSMLCISISFLFSHTYASILVCSSPLWEDFSISMIGKLSLRVMVLGLHWWLPINGCKIWVGMPQSDIKA